MAFLSYVGLLFFTKKYYIITEKKMSILEIFLIGVSLSMDAFAVSICKGLAMKKIDIKKVCIVGLWFGGFQALMPALGYFLGIQFKDKITTIDHWIAFVLLALIGANMIREALKKDDGEETDDSLKFTTMLLLAIATSIDALAIGITFAFLEANIAIASSIIGITTFVFAAVGLKIGNVFGEKYKSKAEIAGGIILIVLGLKILIEHLM
jgi:manganese efflux pump family protein